MYPHSFNLEQEKQTKKKYAKILLQTFFNFRLRKAGSAEEMNQTLKMDQLWKIALSAQNTDVSMKAIQILNSAYFGQGEEFLVQCMQNLMIKELPLGSEEVLTKIQRALLLLKTYLETFRRKYAYHFRRMSIDGQGVLTHAELVDLKSLGPIRYVIYWFIFLFFSKYFLYSSPF
jgi:hypothetical protein